MSPVSSSTSEAEGLVFLTAVGATGATVPYQANNGDIVVCTGSVGVGGTGAAIVVTLPSVVGLIKTGASQPPVGASGPALPGVVDADSLCVTVRRTNADSGTNLATSVVTADGSDIDGASGCTGLSLGTAASGYKLVSKGGNWYTI
jgi:hypothetical protein